MHCDLMVYMLMHPQANPEKRDFGASFPYLREGNVKLQVMAMYTTVEPESSQHGPAQSEIYKQLLKDYAPEFYQAGPGFTAHAGNGIATVAAIESASGICNETEPLDNAFRNLDLILENVGRLFYISFTHHLENRFGGGNYATAGLKPDGEALLEYMAGKQIAIDLSHTSDALAHDILDYTYKKGLEVPVIASHSNVRGLTDVSRNLSDKELDALAAKGGVIHIAPFRGYLFDSSDEALVEAIKRVRVEAGVAEEYLYPFELYWEIEDPVAQREFLTAVSDLLGPGRLDDMLDHIDYVVKRVGVDHVGIGTDFNHGSGIQGFEDASGAMSVTAGLLARGYSPKDIAAIWGGNFIRVWHQARQAATM